MTDSEAIMMGARVVHQHDKVYRTVMPDEMDVLVTRTYYAQGGVVYGASHEPMTTRDMIRSMNLSATRILPMQEVTDPLILERYLATPKNS